MFSFKEKNIKKYKLSRILRLLLTASLLLLSAGGFARQFQSLLLQDTIKSDSIIISDTLNLRSDSIIIDSTEISKGLKKPFLEGEVSYTSEDSLIFSINQQKVYLYDQGVVNYKVQDVSLTGDYIELTTTQR